VIDPGKCHVNGDFVIFIIAWRVFQTLREDLAKVQEHKNELQRKFDATRARCKVLAGEVKSLKSQVSEVT